MRIPSIYNYRDSASVESTRGGSLTLAPIMNGNNAYNKDIFNDILVVQGSVITATKLTNNKSLLSQFLY